MKAEPGKGVLGNIWESEGPWDKGRRLRGLRVF